MPGPSDNVVAARQALGDHPPDHDDGKDEASLEAQPDSRAESRRKWVAENRDRVRDLNRRWRAEHLERARELNRDSMRRAAARKRREVEVRERGRERAKRWREAHPDRVRAYQQRWGEENREKVPGARRRCDGGRQRAVSHPVLAIRGPSITVPRYVL